MYLSSAAAGPAMMDETVKFLPPEVLSCSASPGNNGGRGREIVYMATPFTRLPICNGVWDDPRDNPMSFVTRCATVKPTSEAACQGGWDGWRGGGGDVSLGWKDKRS